MPSIQEFYQLPLKNLKELKKVAKKFKVSPYSCLVRLKQLNLINQKKYMEFKRKLNDEYEESQKKFTEVYCHHLGVGHKHP